MQYFLVAFAFLTMGFAFMALMLYFSSYRKKPSTCCGDALEDFEQGENCDTCPNKNTKACPADAQFATVHED